MASKPTKRSVNRSTPTPGRPPPSPSGRGAAPNAVGAGPIRLLHVLSDSTGNLPGHMLTAFLTQFPAGTFDVRMKAFLRNELQLEQALDAVAAAPGAVLHAVIPPAFKARIAGRCEALGLPHRDLTGPLVDFLAQVSGVAPRPDPHRLHEVDEAYLKRIQAIEFTLEHDDGLGLDTLADADVVLAGVSRTSKTPTSIYLAQQGYRVANVSLAPAVEPPRQLLELPADRVVGLVIDPHQLAEIRTRRQTGWKMSQTSYNEPDHVKQEVAWSRRLFVRQGWRVIDVTDQAIEETAAHVLEMLRARKA